MKPDSLIFDLDGTLWDTSESCAIAWNRVLKRLGIPYRTITGDDVRLVTGRPHEECIRISFSDLPESDVLAIAHETMTEDTTVIAELGGTLYPDVPTGLETLFRSYRLFIVSNCQSGYIETFFKLSGLGHLFADYECWGNTNHTKGANVADVIARNKLICPIMVGDAEGDERAANECGIPFAYAEYGFGAATEPQYRFQDFRSLVAHFTEFSSPAS